MIVCEFPVLIPCRFMCEVWTGVYVQVCVLAQPLASLGGAAWLFSYTSSQKPKWKYVSVPFKDLSLSSHPATAVTSSNNSVYIWGCMGTCVTRSWALRMDWVGKNMSNEGISTSYQGYFLCQSLTCGSAYASLQIHLFIFELMHSSNVTFTRFS